MSARALREPSRRLLSEARDWHLLGHLFECPRDAWRQRLKALVEELDEGNELRRIAQLAVGARQEDYLAVLGPGSTVSPREVAYLPMGDPGKILAQLSHLYRAFGYRPSSSEPLDHLAVQLGFASFLCLKQGYALENDDESQARQCARALEVLCEEHLGVVAAGLAERLSEAPESYLTAACGPLLSRLPPPQQQMAGARGGLTVLGDAPSDQSGWDCGLSGKTH